MKRSEITDDVPSGIPDAVSLDMQSRAALARLTGALSPAAAALAAFDWLTHLAISPGKQLELMRLALRQSQALVDSLVHDVVPQPQPQPQSRSQPPAAASAPAAPRAAHPLTDRRFAAPGWQRWPFNLWSRAFLLSQQWWEAATHGVLGVEKHHEDLVAFGARQWLDVLSPGNLPWANPVVVERTVDEGGANLVRGWMNWVDDVERQASGAPPAGADAYEVGRDVAVTPGKVVLRNRLIELIQYAPTTPTVRAEPILIVPAWIMKYYILDLSPHNSLIRYLVDHGHTVFCISWKNPGAAERDLGMDDYLSLGIEAALQAVGGICPGQRIHATGYCLGGTLLAIAAAAMARDGDRRLATTTYFAAQTDFEEPGELGLFIDESQLSLLEAQMAQTGYLQASQMAGAFSMLRSYDLLWSRIVSEYLLGDRAAFNDLMAWNADATRMPARMHSEYLRRLFLDDDLSESRYLVDGRPVSLGTVRLPTFVVGTQTDHVAPWRSVYKLHYLSPADITFVLTTGGHNVGVVNPPAPDSRRRFQLLRREQDGAYVAPDDWLARASEQRGSWWPAWQAWLAEHSSAELVEPPGLGNAAYAPLTDAPGTYVREH